MKIEIILNGELKTCCSAYPTEQVQSILNNWFAGDDTVEPVVIDIKKDTWREDERFTTAYKYFGDNVFPMVYVGDKLAAIGNLPSRDQLLALAAGGFDDPITVEQIIEAARSQGADVQEKR